MASAAANEPEARRRRDAAATRRAILAAAAHRFACQGYERAGVRQIAADAGVTAALVNRYFGSKEGLFAQVIEEAFDLRPLIAGGRAGLAERLARRMVHGREDDPPAGSPRLPLLLLLRSATEPRAAALIREGLDRNNLRALAETLGGPDAPLRAAMVLAQLTGFAILDQMLRPAPLAAAGREELVALLAASFDACIEAAPRPAPPFDAAAPVQ
jgi:AcrR family transcriptional regulator